MADIETDVLIIGGGLVGGTLACALAGAGIPSLTVDKDDPATLLAAEYDGRCSAVAQACARVLEATGLWARMKDDCAPIEQIRVSDGDSLMFLHYDYRNVGDAPLGHMAENRIMRKAILSRLPELSDTATLIAPATVVALERTGSCVRATLSDGRTITAQLAVAADGRPSPTRRAAGIRLTKWDYHQTAIVLTVAHEKSHQYIAHEHFLPSGPFAILPLAGGHRASIVWTEKTRLAPGFLGLPEDAFRAEFARRFGDFLGDFELIGPRFAYPLSLQYAERYVDRRLALIGDAAHGMHPIAGQGMNFGLRDVAALAEVLVEARRLGLDLGNPSVLTRYQRWRRFDTMVMLGLTDVLNRLFANDIPPLKLARDLGLAVVDKLPPVKQLFMRHAMGTVGELPRLMRGEAL